MKPNPLPNLLPKVSIVMSLYNHKAFLPRRIESFQNQTLTDWELIIVDDCSTDGSYDLVCALTTGDGRITVLRNEFNRGFPATCQRGFDQARGEYLYRADSDDYCAPAFLERLCALMDEHPAVGLAHCRGLGLDERDGSWGGWPRQKSCVTPGLDVFRRALVKYHIKAPTILFRRFVLVKAGGFSQDFGASNDWHLTLRMCLLADVAFLDERLSYHRSHGGNMSGDRSLQINARKIENDTFGVIDSACAHAPEALRGEIEALRRAAYVNIAQAHYRIARWAREQGMEEQAQQLEALIEKYVPLEEAQTPVTRPGLKQHLHGLAGPLIKRFTYKKLPPLRLKGG